MAQGFSEHIVYSKAWSEHMVLICYCLLLLTFSWWVLSSSASLLVTRPYIGITEGLADSWKQEWAQLLSLCGHCCTTAFEVNHVCHLYPWCTSDLIFLYVYIWWAYYICVITCNLRGMWMRHALLICDEHMVLSGTLDHTWAKVSYLHGFLRDICLGGKVHILAYAFFLAPRICRSCLEMLWNFLLVSRYRKFPSLCYSLN